jgi:hypothetical protein
VTASELRWLVAGIWWRGCVGGDKTNERMKNIKQQKSSNQETKWSKKKCIKITLRQITSTKVQ